MKHERRTWFRRFLVSFLLIVVVAVGAPASAQTFNSVSTPGFGDTNNTNVGAMAIFNSMLVVGTGNSVTGTEIWRLEGSGWVQINTDGFGSAANRTTNCLAVYGGRLYAGTYNITTGTEVWEYDGANWSQANADGFGTANNQWSNSMSDFGGYLYVGTGNTTTGLEVWRYDGSNWSQVNSDGFGTANNRTTLAATILGAALYLGTSNSADGAQVWEWNGMDWRQIIAGGFGDPTNAAIASNGLVELGGFLIAGTFNPTGGTVWEIDPQPQAPAEPGIPSMSGIGAFFLVLLIAAVATFILPKGARHTIMLLRSHLLDPSTMRTSIRKK